VACANLALADNDHPALAHARLTLSFAWKDGQLDGSTKCAMQLVQLGANPTRKFNLDNARDSVLKQVLRLAGMDGKSALQLAQMTKRKELVELMEQHLRYSLEERADVVHCRCGSRLPWKSCHATGLGQPPHFRVRPTLGGLVYRFSPYARCPCKNTTLAHYDCCWKETATPAYLIDNNADLAWMYRLPKYSYAGQVAREVLEREGPNAVFSGEAMDRIEIGSLLRSPTTSSLRALFAAEGPKSQWEAWDPAVYAGCVERLDRPFFLWKDLHWKLDKSELLRRTEAWNKALDRYCSDMDLVGEDRDRVVARHAANPCAPCGRDGCDAFENEVREFPRCSRCKMIAYCGRACQKMDWAHHGRTCRLV
jgi:MYND finger